MGATDSFFARAVAKGIIFFAIVLAGGALGYLYQARFFDVMSLITDGPNSSQYDERMRDVQQPVSDEEYRSQTGRGWYWGCIAGAVFGTGVVAQLTLGDRTSASRRSRPSP